MFLCLRVGSRAGVLREREREKASHGSITDSGRYEGKQCCAAERGSTAQFRRYVKVKRDMRWSREHDVGEGGMCSVLKS